MYPLPYHLFKRSGIPKAPNLLKEKQNPAIVVQEVAGSNPVFHPTENSMFAGSNKDSA